jgi:serine/threonine-protein kinase
MILPVWIDRYEVGEEIGRGAAATVHRGHDTAMHRPVALKLLRKCAIAPAELEHTLGRLRQEAAVVARLNHARIAAVYDFVETAEIACIVMELVPGKTLALRLAQQGACDFAAAWEIARQILEGLAYCHGQGVIHRDVKPANVIVGNDCGVKITDFGVARVDTSTLTQLGDVLGSPPYMAPEQCMGLPSTERTDLYQAGAIVYELVTGERPFRGQGAGILWRILHERPPNPSLINPRIPPQLDWAIQTALAKDPDERFDSVREFAEALRHNLERCAA